MKIPPIKLKYTKVECSTEEEQQVLDNIFDLLFNFMMEKKILKIDVVQDLTITGV